MSQIAPNKKLCTLCGSSERVYVMRSFVSDTSFNTCMICMENMAEPKDAMEDVILHMICGNECPGYILGNLKKISVYHNREYICAYDYVMDQVQKRKLKNKPFWKKMWRKRAKRL